MKIKVLSAQSLSDIAIQVYGSIELVLTLATENGKEITDTLLPGEELEYNPDHVLQKRVAAYFKNKKLHPATAFSGEVDPEKIIFDHTFDETFN